MEQTALQPIERAALKPAPVVTPEAPVVIDASPVVIDASPVVIDASPVVIDASPVVTHPAPSADALLSIIAGYWFTDKQTAARWVTLRADEIANMQGLTPWAM